MTPPDRTDTTGVTRDADLRAELRALPADERSDAAAEVAAPLEPAAAPQPDDRPVLVKDDFVLAAADPVSAAEREAARAERRRRRELRKAAQRRRKRRRLIVTVLGVVLLVVACFVGWVRWTTSGLDRIPHATVAGGAAAPGTTILLVGSNPAERDDIGGDVTWPKDLAHSDLVMLLHVPADGGALYAISLPGRLQLPLPDGTTGRLGSLMGNGGQRAYVQAVQDVTGVHVDHLAVLDLTSLQEIVDELGGVDVQVPGKGCDEQPGRRTLDGDGALELMRYRSCLPNGDLDRVAREQAVLRGVLSGVVDAGLTNPFRLNRFAKDTFDHLAVDQGWSLLGMAGTAWAERGVTPATTRFLTVPTRRNAQGRLRIDDQAAGDLWSALRGDQLDEYVALNRDQVR